MSNLIKKRFKYAGHIFDELLKAGWELETAISFVNNIPDADVVEVVRCKDCISYEADVEYYGGGTKNICRLFKRQMREDCYCSYGKKVE